MSAEAPTCHAALFFYHLLPPYDTSMSIALLAFSLLSLSCPHHASFTSLFCEVGYVFLKLSLRIYHLFPLFNAISRSALPPINNCSTCFLLHQSIPPTSPPPAFFFSVLPSIFSSLLSPLFLFWQKELVLSIFLFCLMHYLLQRLIQISLILSFFLKKKSYHFLSYVFIIFLLILFLFFHVLLFHKS